MLFPCAPRQRSIGKNVKIPEELDRVKIILERINDSSCNTKQESIKEFLLYN
jgi:hypothetical protein